LKELISKKVFTVEIDGQPTLALDAPDMAFAQGICALPEFRLDLAAITANASPIFPIGARLSLREASITEANAFKEATQMLPSSSEMTFVFLIKTDQL
jgi:hypothetical protein